MMWDDGDAADMGPKAKKRKVLATAGAAKPKRRRRLDAQGPDARCALPSPRAQRVVLCKATPPLEGTITVGSDCAGLVTEGLALDMLGVRHKHLFVSEINPDVRHLIYNLYGRDMLIYKDCSKRDLGTVPHVDLYVFGFPCQPFSPAGKGEGLNDPRSAVLKHCLHYVQHKLPLLVVVENSARLAGRKFQDVRDLIVNQLKKCGYQVDFAVLNTREQGLPQSRPRFYLVARLSAKQPFSFPPKINPVPLTRLLEAPGATAAVPQGAKSLERTRAHAQAARLKLEAKGVRPDSEECNVVIDVGASPAWGHAMTDCSPCLTAQRCAHHGGHYLLRFKRTMTEKEVCRLQGIPDGRVDYVQAGVPKAKFLHAVGNAMSSNVLARILAHALPASGLVPASLKPPSANDIFNYLVKT